MTGVRERMEVKRAIEVRSVVWISESHWHASQTRREDDAPLPYVTPFSHTHTHLSSSPAQLT